MPKLDCSATINPVKWHRLRAGGVSASMYGYLLGLWEGHGSENTPAAIYLRSRETLDALADFERFCVHLPALLNDGVAVQNWLDAHTTSSRSNYPMIHGQRYEPAARDRYLQSKYVDYSVESVRAPTLWSADSDELSFIMATPDIEIVGQGGTTVRGVEFKIPMGKQTKIKVQYWWQCQVQMFCMGTSTADFFSMFAGSRWVSEWHLYACRLRYCPEAISWSLGAITLYQELALALNDLEFDDIEINWFTPFPAQHHRIGKEWAGKSADQIYTHFLLENPLPEGQMERWLEETVYFEHK